jgi:hypothetical protein
MSTIQTLSPATTTASEVEDSFNQMALKQQNKYRSTATKKRNTELSDTSCWKDRKTTRPGRVILI